MIEVTRLNGATIVLNCDLIKMAEASPDTTITLVNGEKLLVRDSLEQIVERALAYRARQLVEAARHLFPASVAAPHPAQDELCALQLAAQAAQAKSCTTATGA